jgi:hypothetical protein
MLRTGRAIISYFFYIRCSLLSCSFALQDSNVAEMNKSREGSIFLHFSLCATAFVFIRVQWLRRSNRRKEKETLLQARNEILSPSLSISYSLEPLVILKGRGTYLYDDTGRQYLE